jgi:hypothetical protein
MESDPALAALLPGSPGQPSIAQGLVRRERENAAAHILKKRAQAGMALI